MASSTSNKDVVDIEINYHKVTNKVDDSFIILKHITLMSHLLKNQEKMFLRYYKQYQLQKHILIQG